MRSWKDKIPQNSDMQYVDSDALVVEMPHGYAVVEVDVCRYGIAMSFYSKKGQWVTNLAYFTQPYSVRSNGDYLLKTCRFHDENCERDTVMRFNASDIAGATGDMSGMTLATAVRTASKNWNDDAIRGLAMKLDCDSDFTSIMDALADKLEDK